MASQEEQHEALKAFIRALVGNLRMNYGRAMADLGIDADTIIGVQQAVAGDMVEWLETI